jgi:hypothetical protein
MHSRPDRVGTLTHHCQAEMARSAPVGIEAYAVVSDLQVQRPALPSAQAQRNLAGHRVLHGIRDRLLRHAIERVFDLLGHHWPTVLITREVQAQRHTGSRAHCTEQQLQQGGQRHLVESIRSQFEQEEAQRG